MSCYHPVLAYHGRKTNPKTGKRPIVFKPEEAWTDMPVKLPCGWCIGCRMEKARQWKVRLIHEASLHDHNCFVTLTYRPEQVPLGETLVKRDLQLFFKRLRDRIDVPIKFYACGEYGELLSRPHYHACIFGYDFPDKVLWKASFRPDRCLYRSGFLESVWTEGFSSIGAVTEDSAGYVAKYVLKKVTGKNSEAHYGGRVPEFSQMSRGGKAGRGIAHDWFERYQSDVFPKDFVTQRGARMRAPRYYDKLYEEVEPDDFKTVKAERIRKAKENPHNLPRRLLGREKYQEAVAERAVRPFEGGNSDNWDL